MALGLSEVQDSPKPRRRHLLVIQPFNIQVSASWALRLKRFTHEFTCMIVNVARFLPPFVAAFQAAVMGGQPAGRCL